MLNLYQKKKVLVIMWMIEIECGANGENIQCRPAVKFYVTSKFLKHWTKQVVFENYLQHKQPFEDFLRKSLCGKFGKVGKIARPCPF